MGSQKRKRRGGEKGTWILLCNTGGFEGGKGGGEKKPHKHKCVRRIGERNVDGIDVLGYRKRVYWR